MIFLEKDNDLRALPVVHAPLLTPGLGLRQYCIVHQNSGTQISLLIC